MHKTFLVVLVGLVIIGTSVSDSLQANQTAPSREALYRSFLQEELRTNPQARANGVDIETDPEFLQDYFSVLQAFEASRVEPVRTSGVRVEQGACPRQPCGPLLSASEGNGLRGLPKVDQFRLSPLTSGSRTATLRWDAPRMAANADNVQIAYYEVLVVDNSSYSVHKLDRIQTVGAPRRNRGVNRVRNPGNELGALDGDKPNRETHVDRSRPQQYFILNVQGLFNAQVYVRAVYTQSSDTSGSLIGPRDQVIRGEFSDPVQINTTQRSASGLGGGGALQTCVVQAIQSDKNITQPSQLINLDCSNRGITSLVGIEALSNLQTLVLDQNPLSSITRLAQLTSLRSVSLSSTNVTTIDALQSLVNLESLIIANTGLTSLMPLANLNQLESVHAQNNAVTYIPDLSATAIVSLYLGGNPITDTDGIRAAYTLQELRLDNANIGDVDPMIDNATNAGSALSLVNLTGNDSIYCQQLDALQVELGLSSGGGPGLVRPSNCVDIQAPVGLGTTTNPSIGNDFNLSWSTLDNNSAYTYEVEASLEGVFSGLYLAASESLNFNLQDLLLPVGRHSIKVRSCVNAGAGRACGGWSLDLEQIVLSDPGTQYQSSTRYSNDDVLDSCIHSHMEGLDTTGELTYLNCSNYGIQELDGIEQYGSLVTLLLNQNQISVLDELEFLPNLDRLELYLNQINDDQLQYVT
ncbi:MAG: hypothetical protein AAGH65_10540, partial [Pseudomonadota bacterium]